VLENGSSIIAWISDVIALLESCSWQRAEYRAELLLKDLEKLLSPVANAGQGDCDLCGADRLVFGKKLVTRLRDDVVGGLQDMRCGSPTAALPKFRRASITWRNWCAQLGSQQ
jgi:hypothetical protein